jgi:para-nitrobenzyl esterase
MKRETSTKNGRVLGHPGMNRRITVFKGIPFAKAPVGDLRWKAPQPAENWEGVRVCNTFGPISMQHTPGEGDPEDLYNKEWHVDSAVPMDEDCLYLNVWTPSLDPDANLPVMFWIFGGGFQVGYTSEMEFEGERFAKRNCVFVSVNYRLNIFGFFAHPELTESQPEAPTNFAFLDQEAGMRWVKENIRNFGGDPDNITIMGQSAGAGSVMAQLCKHKGENLFQKAILQSGGGVLPLFRHGYPDLAEQEQKGLAFLEYLGVKTLAEARAIDACTLFDRSAAYLKEQNAWIYWQPTLDGVFIKKQVHETVLANELAEVSILSGVTQDEFLALPTEDELALLDQEQRKKLQGKEHNLFELSLLLWGRMNEKCQKLPMYLYYFCPPMPGDDHGVFHSSDLWFSFETLANCWRPFTGEYYDLARMMCNYWTNFARSGNPNGKDITGLAMPEWKAYKSTNEEAVMRLDLRPGMTGESNNPLTRVLLEHYLYRYTK